MLYININFEIFDYFSKEHEDRIGTIYGHTNKKEAYEIVEIHPTEEKILGKLF